MTNEARATVRVSVYIDLIGNFRSAELGMTEGWRVEKKRNRWVYRLPYSRMSSGKLDHKRSHGCGGNAT